VAVRPFAGDRREQAARRHGAGVRRHRGENPVKGRAVQRAAAGG